MYKKIIVALDGSDIAEQVIGTAAGIARRAGGELILVHVVDFDQSAFAHARAEDNWYAKTAEERAHEYILQSAQATSDLYGVRVSTYVTYGDTCEGVAEAAQKYSADLIAITSHGQGQFKSFWLGSVTDRLLRQSGPPLLLLRAETSESTVRGDEPFRHIVVALDGSEAAERVIYPAAWLASVDDAKLSLLQVLVPALIPALAGSFDNIKETEALDYLDELRSAYKFLVRDIQCGVTTADGSIPDAILEFVQQQNADLIALSTHEVSGFRRLLLGDAADKVIRASGRPILVHRT